MWESNKYRDIGPRWGGWSRVHIDNLRGGSANSRTTITQRRGPRKERTIDNSRTIIGGNYSRTKGRVIEDVIIRSKTIYWISGGGNHICIFKGRYITISWCTSWDYGNYSWITKSLEGYIVFSFYFVISDALPSSLWTHLRVQVCGNAEAVGTWGRSLAHNT
jgi:hypothetical protein